MTLLEAETFLSQYQAYDWLTKDPIHRPMWTITDIVDALKSSGILPRVSRDLIVGWCEGVMPDGQRALPGAVNYKGALGWRIPREDIFIFFAERRAEKIQRTMDDASAG